MNRKPKGRIRWGALTAALSAVGGVIVTVISDPHVITSVAGKLGVSAALVGATVSAVAKAVVRQEHER